MAVSWVLVCKKKPKLNTKLGEKLTIPSLNGIGAGPAETVQPAVIADIFFLHDRKSDRDNSRTAIG